MPAHNLDVLCSQSIPFLFLADFEGKTLECYTLDELDDADIEFVIGYQGAASKKSLKKHPLPFEAYRSKINTVKEHIRSGETYLLNLTQPTPIVTDWDLKTIYTHANAPYKLRYKDRFVCFSPEKFIEIIDNTIYTYPMKGTIDSSTHNAHAAILNNEKEMAEHLMVVDLLRNDLGIVASNIKVERFRYIEKIDAGEKELLQVSSKISGELAPDWKNHIHTILSALLPAGSISGTPKKRTVEIIKKIEDYDRGFFTGTFGYFDGSDLYSAVMIRFIEKIGNTLVYKSGGGITIDSDIRQEYEEMIDKIYIP